MTAKAGASIAPERPPTGRLILGGAILAIGFVLCPLLVPVVTASDLPTGWKTALSGLLLIGIPELVILLAVAILGKAGYAYLKQRIFALFRKAAPPDRVSRLRYRFGLVLFVVPLLIGWAAPYVGDVVPGYRTNVLNVAIAGDVMLLCGLFLLGGDFWDKLRGLFIHAARIEMPSHDSERG